MNIKQKIMSFMLVCGGQACLCQVITPACPSTGRPEVISSAGAYFSNTNGSLSWTLGEPVTATVNSNNYILTQGFQQPANITVTGLPQTPKGALNAAAVSVYPDPATSSIYIERDGGKQLLIQLIDVNGKEIINKTLSPAENQLDLSGYANGVYLLKVYNSENQFIQSLKIVKTN